MKRLVFVFLLLLSLSAFGRRDTAADTVYLLPEVRLGVQEMTESLEDSIAATLPPFDYLSNEGGRETTFVLPEVKLEVPEIVEFIEDSIAPMLPRFHYSPRKDEIEIRIAMKDNGVYSLCLLISVDDEFTMSTDSIRGIMPVAGIPLVIRCSADCELVKYTGQETSISKWGGFPTINDNFVAWTFIYSENGLALESFLHFNNEWLHPAEPIRAPETIDISTDNWDSRSK